MTTNVPRALFLLSHISVKQSGQEVTVFGRVPECLMQQMHKPGLTEMQARLTDLLRAKAVTSASPEQPSLIRASFTGCVDSLHSEAEAYRKKLDLDFEPEFGWWVPTLGIDPDYGTGQPPPDRPFGLFQRRKIGGVYALKFTTEGNETSLNCVRFPATTPDVHDRAYIRSLDEWTTATRPTQAHKPEPRLCRVRLIQGRVHTNDQVASFA